MFPRKKAKTRYELTREIDRVDSELLECKRELLNCKKELNHLLWLNELKNREPNHIEKKVELILAHLEVKYEKQPEQYKLVREVKSKQ